MQELSAKQRTWLQNEAVFPEIIRLPINSGGELVCRVLDRDADGRVKAVARRYGFKGFVLRVQEVDSEEVYAAKFCVPGDYVERSAQDEVRLAGRLRAAGELFVRPLFVGKTATFPGMPDGDDGFVWFLSDWIEGKTLSEYIESGPEDVDPEFVCSVGLEILRAIKFLASNNLKHDDLHAGNVMISSKDPALALLPNEKDRLRIQIIDMGSLKPLDQNTRKSRDDQMNLVDILVQLHNGLWVNRKVASTYPHFVRKLRELIDNLVDDDHLRHFHDESVVAMELTQLKSNLQPSAQQALDRAFHPFEAISAEHLADDTTLLELFVSNLPWMANLQEKKPIVFTGPRGCGKSMIFRYMAARTHIGNPRLSTSQPANSISIDSFGVYVSCASHLQNNLSWIARKAGRARELSKQISTFFQLVVVRELLKAIGTAYNDAVAQRKYELTESGIDDLLSFINTYFKAPIETPRLTTRQRVFHFADDIDRVRVRLNMTMLDETPSDVTLPDTFLGDVTAKLAEALPNFQRSPIVFLLDDYSSNRVQPDIQKILNRIIFERRPSHYFKVSCEKFGFLSEDIDGTAVDDTREYVIVDAGKDAFNIPDATVRAFISKLIDQRLKTANWKGRCDILIGQSKPYDNDVKLAKFIRTDGSSQGQRHYYYGLEHLARLWSGDTATILQIVKEMFLMAGVTAQTESIIPVATQHDAITSVSKAFKERVSGYHPFGPLMSNVLNEFGNSAREILVNGTENKGGEPRRLYRIEMTKDRPQGAIDLLHDRNPEAALLAKEILRRAIFVELLDSRGKEGPSATTMRWELRKIFLPAFGLSLVRNHYYDLKGTESLLSLLIDPQQFATKMKMQYSLGRKQDKQTINLFDADEDGHE